MLIHNLNDWENVRIIAFENTMRISTIITHDAFSNASTSGSRTVLTNGQMIFIITPKKKKINIDTYCIAESA